MARLKCLFVFACMVLHFTNAQYFDVKPVPEFDELSSGDQSVISESSNGYLPPVGAAPSDRRDTVVKLEVPSEGEESSPTLVQPQLGCAAAMICVEEQYCDMIGMISKTPVQLSEAQLLRRVPMVDCRNPNNGVVGKCCRDPDYVDPWPAGGALPPNYKGGFDQQGFPLVYNLTYTTTPRPSYGNGNRAPVRPAPVARPVAPVAPVRPAPVARPIAPLAPQTSLPQPSFVSSGSALNPVPQRPPVRVEVQTGSSGYVESRPQPAPFQPQPTEIHKTTYPGQPPKTLPIQNIQSALSNQISNVLSQKPFSQPPQRVVPSVPARPSVPLNNVQISSQPSGVYQNYVSSTTGAPLFESNQNQGYDYLPPVIQPHTPGAQCGLINKVQTVYGLNDVEVPFGSIPWQAMILSNSEKKLLCSGAIIAPNLVLTTAQCIYDRDASDVSAKAGEWKLGYELKHEEPLPFEIVQVKQIATHPNYQPGLSGYDMAMLILEKPFKLDLHVDTLCISERPVVSTQRKCISTGWGKTIVQIHAAGALLNKINVDMLSDSECRNRLQGSESPIDIDDSQVCVKPSSEKNNMCQVDMGGPLACDRGDGFYEIVGVYSQDTGCLPTNQVATFTVIDTQWINSIMSSGSAPTAQFDYAGATPLLQQPQQPELPLETPSKIHYHQPGVPCDCRQGTIPAGLNQYLPPQ